MRSSACARGGNEGVEKVRGIMMQHLICIVGSKAKSMGLACEASNTERVDEL